MRPLKTKVFFPPFDLIKEFDLELKNNSFSLKEKDIVVITSKVVALSQNRIMDIKSDEDIGDIVKKESGFAKKHKIHDLYITIKDGYFMPNAGIDRSNIPEGKIVLYPKNIHFWTIDFLKKLKEKYNLKELGLIITDSRCFPLRWGVSGVACGFAGFVGLEDRRGFEDIYGKKLRFTRVNKADMIASSAVLLMGESDEVQPFCIVREAPVIFNDRANSKEVCILDPDECLYSPIYDQEVLAFKNKSKIL